MYWSSWDFLAWQQLINIHISNVHNTPETLYNEADHLSSYSRIEAIDYHTTLTHAGISITPYHAGHVLGGAMFFIEIAGLKIMFTGDYSREDDRHLVSAEIPPDKPDLLICESTYGTATHMPRLEKEARLMKMTTDILTRGGRVLMPVFALGRAQELLLILDEYWEKHPQFQTYPIYYASNLARKCMDVYRTYINTMNDRIKKAMFEEEGRNPWDFRWVRSLKAIDRFEDVGGCVMLASPGMMQVKALLTLRRRSYFFLSLHVVILVFVGFQYLYFSNFYISCGFVGIWRIKAEHCRFRGSIPRAGSGTTVLLGLHSILARSLCAMEIMISFRFDIHDVVKINIHLFHHHHHHIIINLTIVMVILFAHNTCIFGVPLFHVLSRKITNMFPFATYRTVYPANSSKDGVPTPEMALSSLVIASKAQWPSRS